MLVVRGDSIARSLAELIAEARARPGQLNYLRAGNGSFAHMAMELIQRVMGFQATAVDYRGLPPGILDLLAGRLDVAVLSTGLVRQHIAEGRLRAVAAVGSTRAPELPDVPTLAELGFAEANMDSWYIAVAPRGLPAPALQRVHAAYTRVMGMAAVQQKLRSAGTIPATSLPPPAEVQAFLDREHAKFERLIREANIRAS